MVKGYLLIKLVPGLEPSALSQIRAIPGVTDVNLVFGGWDAIATAEAKSLFELSRIIVGEVRRVSRIRRRWCRASFSSPFWPDRDKGRFGAVAIGYFGWLPARSCEYGYHRHQAYNNKVYADNIGEYLGPDKYHNPGNNADNTGYQPANGK
jgi:hypothetical protein